MNPRGIRLFLALLWLVPGVGLLVHGLWTGDALDIRFGRWQVPLAAPFLLMAAFNFVRWWATRIPSTKNTLFRHRRRPTGSESESDPAFRFDEPPPHET
jgi:hypothetical protein